MVHLFWILFFAVRYLLYVPVRTTLLSVFTKRYATGWSRFMALTVAFSVPVFVVLGFRLAVGRFAGMNLRLLFLEMILSYVIGTLADIIPEPDRWSVLAEIPKWVQAIMLGFLLGMSWVIISRLPTAFF